MLFIKLLIVFVVSSLLLDGLHAVLGFLLVKTRRFHKAGVRMLAMSLFVSGRTVAGKCHQHCEDVRCGNWTCENFHHAKRK